MSLVRLEDYTIRRNSKFRFVGASPDVFRHYDSLKEQEAKVKVRRAGRLGYGLYAAQDIKKGSCIVEYVGEAVTVQEYVRRFTVYKEFHRYKHKYFATLLETVQLDATHVGNEGRYANHSCVPHAEFLSVQLHLSKHWALFLVAKRYIKNGEQILLDYEWYKSRGVVELVDCRCNSVHCRGFI